jgi:PBP1b-binding outer membrane lipoprotein LpoB
MLGSMKITIKAIAVLLFVTGCTTRTANLQNQVIEDEEALTKMSDVR